MQEMLASRTNTLIDFVIPTAPVLYHGTASFSTFPGHLVKILTCEYRNGMAAMGSKRIAGLL